MRYLKVKAIGDSAVGKTSLLSRWYNDSYSSQSLQHQNQNAEKTSTLPSVLDSFFVNTTVNGETFIVTYWDSYTLQPFTDMDLMKLKPMEYEDIDIFLACFDISNPHSFQNISTVWVPELRYFVPGTPLLVVGNKSDLRLSNSLPTISPDKGIELAKRLGTIYLETSALAGEGLKEMVETAICKAIAPSCHPERKTKRKPSNYARKMFTKLLQPPTLPLQVPEENVIVIPASSYSTNMQDLLSDNCVYSDLYVKLPNRNTEVKLHRIVLCMAAESFRSFLLKLTASADEELIELLSAQLTHEKYSSALCFAAFRRFLDFVYTFDFKLDQTVDRLVVKEVYQMAKRFQLHELAECCENVLVNENYLNIETCKAANARRTQVIRQLFLNKPLLSDVTFLVEDKHFYAHKAIVMARSDVMAAMLGGGFKEGNTEREIRIEDSTDAFLDLLDYLYTDSLRENTSRDYKQLLILSDKFCIPRLRALCELAITNKLKVEIKKRLQLDEETCRHVLQTLLLAESHNADQLHKWCYYIITVYYSDFEHHEDLSLLKPQLREDLDNHRWPPLKYLHDLEEFKRKSNR